MTPQCVRNEIESLFESQDPLSEFLEAKCVQAPRCEILTNDLWMAYEEWCRALNRHPIFRQSNSFSRNLVQRDGIEARRSRSGRFLVGIGLRDDAEGDGYEANSGKPPHEEITETKTPNECLSGYIDTAADTDPLSLLGEWGQEPEESGEVLRMGVVEFLAMLKSQGLALLLRPGHTLMLSPKESITDAIRDYIQANKAEILEELTRQASSKTLVEQLTDQIKAFLNGRPMPITIKPGERILNLDLFALATARDVFSSYTILRDCAGDRLLALGMREVIERQITR
jgi:hypothetical protein